MALQKVVAEIHPGFVSCPGISHLKLNQMLLSGLFTWWDQYFLLPLLPFADTDTKFS